MRCVLVVPHLKGLSTRVAIPPQVPLGHVCVGSQLVREGHSVHLLNADRLGLSVRGTVSEVRRLHPDAVLFGHSASTLAHPVVVELASAVREQVPNACIGYGGAFATFNSGRAFEESGGAIDFVIAGEAEVSTARALDWITRRGDPRAPPPGVIVGEGLHAAESGGHGSGEVICDLDSVAPDWSQDWGLRAHRAFGYPSAVVQFSRGCPRRCAYCGQWAFWKRWRHRSIASFVEEIDRLGRLGVRLFWVADENWSTHQGTFLALLAALSRSRSEKHFVVAMECAHLVRDRAHLALYKEAGISMLMLGYDAQGSREITTEKHFDLRELWGAIGELKKRGVVVVLNKFVSANGSLRAEVREASATGADFYNCLFPTPHLWTPFGSRADYALADLHKHDYRNPVLCGDEAGAIRSLARAKALEVALHWRQLLPGRRRRLSRLHRSARNGSLRVFAVESARLIARCGGHAMKRLRARLAGIRRAEEKALVSHS